MKIALLSPIAWRTPPRHYGPWEQVVHTLAEGLARRKMDVTLFATADSITSAKLDWICDLPYGEDKSKDPKVWECLHISYLMEKADQFDIIHNHYDFLPLTYSRLTGTPMITTIHGFSSQAILPVYQKYDQSTAYISISDADRHPSLNYLRTIYHGLDPDHFAFVREKEDFLLFFGRIHPEKGTHAAIEIARLSGYPLKIAGLIQDQQYFDSRIRPYLDDKNVYYLGNADPVMRNDLLGKARALLHPIYFNEPFGLSVVEAMLCGTPVIAFSRGSMPELIRDGHNGFLVRDVEGAVTAVEALAHLDPGACRDHAITHFSKEKMIDAYLNAYETVLG